MKRDTNGSNRNVVLTNSGTRDRSRILTANLKQVASTGLLFCVLGFSLYFRVFLPMSLWSINSKASQYSSGFLFFTSEQIDSTRNSSFSILASEMSFLSSSANAEVYADIPLQQTFSNNQAFFVLQIPGTASGLQLINVFTGQDLNQFNGTTKIIVLQQSGISYMIITVPKNNVSETLSLRVRFKWSGFSSKISVSEYTLTVSFDTAVSQSFDQVKSSLGLSGQGYVLLPEAAATYRFSLARPSHATLTQVMPTPDNIVYNGSSVWLLWDISQKSDAKKFVSTAITIQAVNDGENELYGVSLTFFLFLIGLGIPLVISALFEYSKSMQSKGLRFQMLRKPAFVLLLLFGVPIALFEALRFFSILNPFGNSYDFWILLFEIGFYLALGFWLGEIGWSSIGTSTMISISIVFDQVMYLRNVMDFAIAGLITFPSFVLGELVFFTLKRTRRKSSHTVEVYGSLLNEKQWKGALAEGRHEEIGKEERVGWKVSFDKQSSRRKEAVLNLVRTGKADDVYYTTLFKVDDVAFEAIMEREMGKSIAVKWKKGERIPDTSYRPVELESHLGKVVVFTIPESGRVQTPTTKESNYVKTVTKGIESLYSGMMRETNLRALERAIRESQP